VFKSCFLHISEAIKHKKKVKPAAVRVSAAAAGGGGGEEGADGGAMRFIIMITIIVSII